MGKEYRQGFFEPTNINKYIGVHNKIRYRSSYELLFMKFCDLDESVLFWNSEGICIPYFSEHDGKYHKYYVDFLVRVKKTSGESETYLIEIKPFRQTIAPKQGKRVTKKYLNECVTFNKNKSKWESAIKFATNNNWKFIILTENDLGISLKNGK